MLLRSKKRDATQTTLVCRLGIVLCTLLITTCSLPDHMAVGRWQATEGDLVLHLFSDGSGSFERRKCTWQEIDEFSVKTDCERPIIDNAVRVFTVKSSEGGEMVGSLESYPMIVFVRRDSGNAQAAQAEIANERNLSNGLEPTWVGKNEAVQALGGQVLIAVFNTSEHSATLRITLPDTSVVALDNMPVGTRRIVKIDGVDYFLDLLDAGEVMGAQVSLTSRK